MTTGDCDSWQGLIALEVVGQLERDPRVALDAHTDQCAACREHRRAMGGLPGVLALADPDHLVAHPVPAHVEEAVLSSLHALAARSAFVTRRRRVVGILGAAAAVLAAVGLAFGLRGPGSPAHSITLAGRGAAAATATLTPEPWGTSVRLVEDRPAALGVYSVWMRSRGATAARWWEAGTYEVTRHGTVDATMACALHTSDIAEIWVRDASGRAVLRAYVD